MEVSLDLRSNWAVLKPNTAVENISASEERVLDDGFFAITFCNS